MLKCEAHIPFDGQDKHLECKQGTRHSTSPVLVSVTPNWYFSNSLQCGGGKSTPHNRSINPVYSWLVQLCVLVQDQCLLSIWEEVRVKLQWQQERVDKEEDAVSVSGYSEVYWASVQNVSPCVSQSQANMQKGKKEVIWKSFVLSLMFYRSLESQQPWKTTAINYYYYYLNLSQTPTNQQKNRKKFRRALLQPLS